MKRTARILSDEIVLKILSDCSHLLLLNIDIICYELDCVSDLEY